MSVATVKSPNGIGGGTQKYLPKWFNGASILASLVIGFLVSRLADSGVAGVLAFLAVYFLVVIFFGFMVAGRRYGSDRPLPSVISGTFTAAIIPILSLSWTVLAQG